VLRLLTIAYVINFLDRTNVGFAVLTMNCEVGLTEAQLAVGREFFVGDCLLEVPSNEALHTFGARVWLSRIMITWVLISMGMVSANGATSFYTLAFFWGARRPGFSRERL
jgi:MFS transporter, ACS family, tartrate transporter